MVKYLRTIIIIFGLLLTRFFVDAAMQSGNYKIQSEDVNVGGSDSSASTNYKTQDSAGGIATGVATSANYNLRAGYRQMSTEFSLTISSPDDIDLGTIPGSAGGIATGSIAWTTITDNPAGYNFSVKASASPALTGQTLGDSFADYTEASAVVPDYEWAILDSVAEFGYSPEGSGVVQKFRDNGSVCATGSNNTADKCWYYFSTTDEAIASSVSPNQPSGTATTLKLKAQLYNEDGVPNNETGSLLGDTYRAVITATAVML